jgi:dTDP-D-glucose 4,6-dehydratase
VLWSCSLAQEKFLTFVEDRFFNDLRYTVNSEALQALGWKEEVRRGHCLHLLYMDETCPRLHWPRWRGEVVVVSGLDVTCW